MVIYRSIVLAFLLTCGTASAQYSGDLSFITNHNPLEGTEKQEYESVSQDNGGKTGIVFMGIIRFYQRFVSSQQNNETTCVFTPSCSHFGYRAIQTHGPLRGILMASDRFQRCHAFGKKYYPPHGEKKKCHDPVSWY